MAPRKDYLKGNSGFACYEKLWSVPSEPAKGKIVGVVKGLSSPRSSLTPDITVELDYAVDYMRWALARVEAF